MLDVAGFFWVISALFGLGGLLPFTAALRPQRGPQFQAVADYTGLTCALAGSLVTVGGAWLGAQSPAGTTVSLFQAVITVPNMDNIVFPWEVRVDRLAAFFLMLIGGFAAVVSLYAFPALRGSQYTVQRGQIVAAFNLFVWATLMVVLAADVFGLFVALEVMTLAFATLTLYKHNLYLDTTPPDPAAGYRARLAPQLYLIVSHASTAFLLVGLLTLALQAGSLRFSAFGQPLGSGLSLLVFGTMLAGLGIRLGLAPAHFWVALVHPASPTLTHAFSLGIAIKVGLYLMVRCFFEWLPPTALAPWSGYTVALLGAGTALVGVWYALASHDLKTALAYHSVENIGIMTTGIGVALIFAGRGADDAVGRLVAGLALLAALYHLLNHAVFKGLLYLGTGVIDNLTKGVVEFERLGGLLRRFPALGAALLAGTFAIAGFPPFNGFISEWLTVQALIMGAVNTTDPLAAGLLLLGLLLLALAFALTAVCFLKIAGLTLLGAPRDPEVATRLAAGRVGPVTNGVLGGLAGLCLGIGLLPGLVSAPLSTLAAAVLDKGPAAAPPVVLQPPSLLVLTLNEQLTRSPPVRGTNGPATAPPRLDLGPTLTVGSVVVLVTLGAIRLRRGRGGFARRVVPPWSGGEPYDPTRMQPSGAVLTFLVRDRVGATYAAPGAARPQTHEYLPADLVVSARQQVPEVAHQVYNRLIRRILAASAAIGAWVQNGDIRRYLLYILVISVIALVLFALRP